MFNVKRFKVSDIRYFKRIILAQLFFYLVGSLVVIHNFLSPFLISTKCIMQSFKKKVTLIFLFNMHQSFFVCLVCAYHLRLVILFVVWSNKQTRRWHKILSIKKRQKMRYKIHIKLTQTNEYLVASTTYVFAHYKFNIEVLW